MVVGGDTTQLTILQNGWKSLLLQMHTESLKGPVERQSQGDRKLLLFHDK